MPMVVRPRIGSCSAVLSSSTSTCALIVLMNRLLPSLRMCYHVRQMTSVSPLPAIRWLMKLWRRYNALSRRYTSGDVRRHALLRMVPLFKSLRTSARGVVLSENDNFVKNEFRSLQTHILIKFSFKRYCSFATNFIKHQKNRFA